MDTVEVKAFNAELSGLYENKPPISKAKMSAITKGAIKAIKFYKHVVHSVEKFIQKCKPEYKVPGLYVIDSIVRQSRHQFGQDKDVFAPRFAKNMQQTFANLFRCPPEDKRNIIRVLNLWQKNNVFGPEVIQPLLDMADPNHPLHQEIQQQNNTANGSSLNITHNSDSKLSPQRQDSPRGSSPMGDQFQDEPSGIPAAKFNRKLLNDFEYESEDEQMSDPPPAQHNSQHMHSQHSHSHSHSQHNNQHGHSQHNMQNTNMSHNTNNPADALGSILTNPEIMRQLQSLQAQMQMMTGVPIPNLMPMMPDMSQQNQNQNLPFLNMQKDQQKTTEPKDDMANESDIEFVETGPQVIEIPDANDSRSPSPVSRRHRSRSRSPRRRRRSRSRSPRRRHGRDRDRDKDKEKSHKEREAEKEKQREREKKGLPPIKKENLSVCSTTLWVGHLSKLATPEELSDLFGAFGGVASIDVVAPRGCAFVVMERRRDAARARAKLDKHKLHSKEITVAWAAGKGVKGREWKDYWEAELGVAYLPWAALHARWLLGALSLDALEEGGAVDEETLPPWLPPRIIPKAGEGMLLGGMLPPTSLPLPAPLPAPPAVPRLPPPGMTPGIPPGMAPGMPPGMRPPSIPTGVPGLQRDGALPPAPLLGFPPGLPQPGMVGGFLGGLMGMGMGGLVLPLHAPHAPAPAPHAPAPALAPAPAHRVPPAQSEPADDAMELDTDEPAERAEPPLPPPPLSLDQIQALLSKPPPVFNSSEPPPGFGEPPDTSQPPPDERRERDKDRRERDRDRDRRDGRDRERRDGRDARDTRDTRDGRDAREGRDTRERRDTREKDRPRDRDRDREDRRDRERGGGGRERRGERERDRERDRFNNRDNNNSERSREKSPRGEKSLQERLWEMANGASEPQGSQGQAGPPQANLPQASQPQGSQVNQTSQPDNASGGESPGAGGDAPDDGGWSALPPPRHGPPMFRAELRMRGPPARPPIRGPWMDLQGPPGPFGPRFNGMGPPFPRPPFDRPFEGAMFERPPFNRMPFEGSRPPYDGPRPSFDGPRPPYDGLRPPFDGSRPPFDGQRPPFDGSRPSFDGSRPPFDGPRPPFDGPRPPFDGPRPPFDGSRPPFDGPRPSFDGPRPPFDNNRKFDGFEGDRSFDGPRFDGPQEGFDRGNRRFDEREQFSDRGWNGDRDRDWDRRGKWEDRRRDRRRDHEDRYRDRNDRRRSYDRPEERSRSPVEEKRDDKRDEKRDDKRDERRDDKREERRDDKREERRDDKREERRDDKREERRDDKREERRDEKREERTSRRDKDRKSRWGAAEEAGASNEMQPGLPERDADVPADDTPGDGPGQDESGVNRTGVDPVSAGERDDGDDQLSRSRQEDTREDGPHSRQLEPPLERRECQRNSRGDEGEDGQNDQRTDSMSDEQIGRESEIDRPDDSEGTKLPLDLYDADEAVDTSFAAPLEPPREVTGERAGDDGDIFSEPAPAPASDSASAQSSAPAPDTAPSSVSPVPDSAPAADCSPVLDSAPAEDCTPAPVAPAGDSAA